jgi:hypothetical protein
MAILGAGRKKPSVVMVRLDWTIQKRLWSLKKSSFNALEGVLDSPVKPENDDEKKGPPKIFAKYVVSVECENHLTPPATKCKISEFNF